MSKSKMKTVAVIVGAGAICDFGFSYYRTHSILGVIIGVVLGLGSTAFFLWLNYDRLP